MDDDGHSVRRPWLYRVQYIHQGASAEDLKTCFASKDRQFVTVKALAVSVDNTKFQTAIIEFHAPNARTRKPEVVEGEGFSNEDVDDRFEGFTPLSAPFNAASVDIVAVTGLGGHAFQSWQNQGRMWLNDFLPRDVSNARILTFGYDTSMNNSLRTSVFLQDCVNHFKEKLKTVRQYSWRRPLIFIGHSLGGLVIKKAIYDISHSLVDSECLRIPLVVFIATPHRGLDTNALSAMAEGTPSEALVKELEIGSQTLINFNDCFCQVSKNKKILTLYENVLTPGVAQGRNGRWTRTGARATMVTRESAVLGLPNETVISCRANHSEIAKLQRGQGSPYPDVVRFIHEAIGSKEAPFCRKASKPDASDNATPQDDISQIERPLGSPCSKFTKEYYYEAFDLMNYLQELKQYDSVASDLKWKASDLVQYGDQLKQSEIQKCLASKDAWNNISTYQERGPINCVSHTYISKRAKRLHRLKLLLGGWLTHSRPDDDIRLTGKTKFTSATAAKRFTFPQADRTGDSRFFDAIGPRAVTEPLPVELPTFSS